MKEIVTARDCWPTQTEFQMNSPRRKLAIEKRESNRVSLKVFLGALSAPNRQIRVQRFVITVSLPYSRTNGGKPKTCSQRISTRDRIGTFDSMTNAASRSRLVSCHATFQHSPSQHGQEKTRPKEIAAHTGSLTQIRDERSCRKQHHVKIRFLPGIC